MLPLGPPCRRLSHCCSLATSLTLPLPPPFPAAPCLRAPAQQDDQQPCFLSHTTPLTNALVAASSHLSVHVTGHPPSSGGGGGPAKGPRYCPSIETKVARHPHLTAHNVWLEPDGAPDETSSSSSAFLPPLSLPPLADPQTLRHQPPDLVYPSGMSITLPAEIQLDVLRSCQGLEHVEMAQPGYGVEYDYVNPRELRRASPLLSPPPAIRWC